MAQRLVRAKRKIALAGIPYGVPADDRLAERLAGVQAVLYLLFTEGHTASEGDALSRPDLCLEAIRLSRLLARLMPEDPETHGLLALMLLTDARRAARTGPGGEPIDLEHQDRGRCDAGRIAEGREALHRYEPTPVVAINLAVAAGLADGPAKGLRLLDGLGAEPALDGCVPLHAAWAELLVRAGDAESADAAYERAIAASANATQRADLTARRKRAAARLDRRSGTARPQEEISVTDQERTYDRVVDEAAPQIVAFGGGGFSMEAGNPLLDDHVLDLATRRAAARGLERPRVCFLPSASGDADHYVVRFYRHFPPARCEPSHVSLFRRDCGTQDIREHLLAQDLIYVGGGSLISLLGVWRAHGLDAVLRECWEAGVLLCGLSAGSLCWFAEGVSAFHAESCTVSGLGLLPCSNAVHYDKEPERRPAFQAAVRAGLPAGYGVDDGAALHFVGTELHEVVSSRPQARAYRVEAVAGEVVEIALESRYLGAEVAQALVA